MLRQVVTLETDIVALQPATTKNSENFVLLANRRLVLLNASTTRVGKAGF